MLKYQVCVQFRLKQFLYGLTKVRIFAHSDENYIIERNVSSVLIHQMKGFLSSEPDYFGRNKILSGYDLSHYQVPHCIRVFFYFVWFVIIHHNFQFYFKLCTYCNILDIYLS